MRLLIISHTPHYLTANGFVGWGATVREINHLEAIFDRIVHIAPLHQGPAPKSVTSYISSRVSVCPVSPSGGHGIVHKGSVVKQIPSYVHAILRELNKVDVVHVRCPANISLLAIMLLSFKQAPEKRWVKYAGNWSPKVRDAFSYRFQRWWLAQNLHRGVVTVNGEWPDQPVHVYSLLNPCLYSHEVAEAETLAYKKQLSLPVRLLYVGRLESAKGADRALEVLASLKKSQPSVTLDLIGDGSERLELEKMSARLGIEQDVAFHGWLTRETLNQFYAKAHFLVLPTTSEGWPKVLSEGMAYGVVPISSDVSSIPQYLQSFDTGKAFPADHTELFAGSILQYASDPEGWRTESEKAVRAAREFIYDIYVDRIRQIIGI